MSNTEDGLDTLHSTLVGIITYNPDIDTLTELMASLVHQDCDVIVFDNASTCQNEIVELFKSWNRVNVWASDANIGLAAAANRIFNIGHEKSYKFVGLFDQDSVPASNYLSTLICWLEGLDPQEQSKIAAISGAQRCRFSGQEAPFVKYSSILPKKIFPHPAGRVENVHFLITSGCIFPVASLESIGLFDEDLFIDNVDVEWCCRAQQSGYLLYGSSGTWFSHSIGDDVYKIFGRIFARKHSPLRSYYSIRNMLALCERPYINRVWKYNSFLRALAKSAFIILIHKERKSYGKQILRAIRDAKNISQKPQYGKFFG